LIKKAVLAVLFEPDRLERLVAFEEKPAVEFVYALDEARIRRVHVWADFR
jgi:hypothetical protein